MKAPPPLVIFENLEKYLTALDAPTEDEHEEEIRRLHQLALPPVVSTRALATLFGYRSQFVGAMRYKPQQYYRVFTIPKGQKRRKIEAPRVSLKVIQKWLGHYLARAIEFPDEIVGFVSGRSTLNGASKHCQASWILSTDIENFFQTTSSVLVTNALQSIGYSRDGAQLIADLSSLNGYLAQGSPCSPVLSNLAFKEVDSSLIALASELQITYTRYADDLVFSGKSSVPENLLSRITKIVEQGKWRISEKKTQLVVPPSRFKVYGLLVNSETPRLTKGYRKRIRAIQHLLEAGKIPDEELERANGHLSYSRSVEKFGTLS